MVEHDGRRVEYRYDDLDRLTHERSRIRCLATAVLITPMMRWETA